MRLFWKTILYKLKTLKIKIELNAYIRYMKTSNFSIFLN